MGFQQFLFRVGQTEIREHVATAFRNARGKPLRNQPAIPTGRSLHHPTLHYHQPL